MFRTTGFRWAGVMGLLALAVNAPAIPAQSATLPPPLGCADFTNDPEETQNYAPLQGSSNLNAQTGNDRMVAGLTSEGTVTVLRWPTPSRFDQVKHFSPDANLPRAGADPNMGTFLGVVVGGRTTWLRDLPETQRYRPGDSDTIITTYRDDDRQFTVTVTAVVAQGVDALIQDVEVRARGPVRPTALVSFENLSLAVAAMPSFPYGDWCLDSLNVDRASWVADAAAIVHDRTGVDPSSLRTESVAIAMGTGSRATEHQVGGDSEELDALLAPQDAYLDATDGRLGGRNSWTGNTTGAVLAPLRYQGDTATDAVYLAADRSRAGAVAALEAARAAGPAALRTAKEQWLRATLADAAMPATTDPVQTALARRALILLATTQAESGAIVASITTQPAYAEDWPRDGAYLAEAMDLGGMSERSRRHGLFLARTQSSPSNIPLGGLLVPWGAWPMNMYDNGASGGPIPYEYDEVGFGAWSMWQHYTHSGDRAYLEEIWPALRRSAEFMVSCRDAQTGLQCRNTEDDSLAIGQQQTIGAAMTTYAGLGAAAAAADVLGRAGDAERYRARRAELIRAIDTHLFDEQAGYYGGLDEIGIRKLSTYVYWPELAEALPVARMQRHSDWVWEQFAPSFTAPSSGRTFGFYDALALLGLGRWDRVHAPEKLPELEQGLWWIAHVQATPGTGHLGENWRVRNGTVQTITATPQLWEHALFYLAALEIYGPQ